MAMSSKNPMRHEGTCPILKGSWMTAVDVLVVRAHAPRGLELIRLSSSSSLLGNVQQLFKR